MPFIPPAFPVVSLVKDFKSAALYVRLTKPIRANFNVHAVVKKKDLNPLQSTIQTIYN